MRVRGEGEGPLARGRRTKDSEMMVLRPAAILGNERGTLVVLRGVVLDQAGWVGKESFRLLVARKESDSVCALSVSHRNRGLSLFYRVAPFVVVSF